ncbi:hypothetical protein NWF32_24225 [Pseudomonas qingdaonensis]|nr:hypothetical protein [Pseudomonas qingdaonensis]
MPILPTTALPWAVGEVNTLARQARFVVDATGKASCIARLGGARRQRLSRQVAVAARLPRGGSELADTEWLLIEADAQGWWSGGHHRQRPASPGALLSRR